MHKITMLLKNSKQYIKEKFLKYDNNRLWTYLWAKNYFNINEEYIVKDGKFYEKIEETKLYSKKEIINKFWNDKWFDIKKSFFEWNRNYYFMDYKLNGTREEVNKIKTYLFDWFYKNWKIKFYQGLGKNQTEIAIKEIISLEKWYYIKEQLFVINDFWFYWKLPYFLSELIIEENKIQQFYKTKIFKNHFYCNIDDNSIKKLKEGFQELYSYKVKSWKVEYKRLIKKNEENNLLLSFFNIEENKIYNWLEIKKLFNKNSRLEKVHDKICYYWTAPRWYRKNENKKFKRQNKQNLERWLKNNNLENTVTIRYKRNASRYF